MNFSELSAYIALLETSGAFIGIVFYLLSSYLSVFQSIFNF